MGYPAGQGLSVIETLPAPYGSGLPSIDKALRQAGSELADAVVCRVYITDAA